MQLDDTLKERGSRYGDFEGQAHIAIGLKTFVADELRRRNKTLAPDQQQALDTIFDKIARIVNGDPDYFDNWHDIAGYATLIERRLRREGKWAINPETDECVKVYRSYEDYVNDYPMTEFERGRVTIVQSEAEKETKE